MKRHPNILLFLPDAMQAQVVRPGHACRTPNFDRLSKLGLRFNRAHTTLPVCSPARASLMTGLLPHNHGVLQVEHCVDEDQSVLRTKHPHWAQRLSEAGYRTGYFGKWHIERTNHLEEFGWQVNGCDASAAFRKLGAGVDHQERLIGQHRLAHYQTTPDGYNPVLLYGVTDVPTDQRPFSVTTRMASNFLAEQSRGDTPWACCVSFSEPNTPLIAGREAFARYDVDSIRLPENFHNDFRHSPALYRRQREIFQCLSERQWRELRAVYYALVTELDRQFGKLLDTLERSGQLERTVVIVSSDHGRYLGAHGFDAHNFGAFEEIYNIPLIIAGPGIPANTTTDALVSLRDLCPTILELAGAKPIGAPDSKSFVPLLHCPQEKAREFNRGYAEYHGTRFALTQRILWDGPWKFVFNGFDYDELYNLENDPHELDNLARDPAWGRLLRSMMTQIWQYAIATGDRALTETHYPPMRLAVVGPNAAKPRRKVHA